MLNRFLSLRRIIVAVLPLLLALSFISSPSAEAATSIGICRLDQGIDTQDTNVDISSEGQEFSVGIIARDIKDLGGADFEVTFDPSVLEATGGSIGKMKLTGADGKESYVNILPVPTYGDNGVAINNSTGSVKIGFAINADPDKFPQGVAGESVVLAAVAFKTKKAASTVISIDVDTLSTWSTVQPIEGFSTISATVKAESTEGEGGNSQTQCSVELIPNSLTSEVGNSFDVEIALNGQVEGLCGIELHLDYNPSVLQLNETGTVMGSSLGSDWMEIAKKIDNSNGSVDLAYGTIASASLVSGSDLEVAVLNFTAKAAGTGKVEIVFDQAANRNTFYQVKAGGSSSDNEFSGHSNGIYTVKSDDSSGNTGASGSGGSSGPSGSTFATSGNTGSAVTSLKDITSHWARGYIEELVSKKIIAGYPDGTFQPEQAVTRAEFIKLACIGLNLSDSKTTYNFADVGDAHWAVTYISAAAKAGLIKGDGLNFNPDNEITRAEVAVIIARALKLSQANQDISFTDWQDLPDWAASEIFAVKSAGIITGYEDNSYRPFNSTTRAEAATMLCKILRNNN
ncbi:MAG: S-layer homology domain-containing protein [Desulfotomaculaceae bacterium]|nr:S-layer homology domain-containing protein [Desulfotomaculaceae bacterium]